MSLTHPNHILLPESSGISASAQRTRLAPFVPIALALVGVSLILFGGLSARSPQATTVEAEVDPIVTGSISLPEEQRRALEMLDR